MELLVKPEMLTLYIYMDLRLATLNSLFLFAAQCFNTESMQGGFCVTFVCKHFAS